MIKKMLMGIVIALLFTGCAKVRDSSRLAQTLNSSLVAGVGDTIIEIDTRESLPNLFGNADLFGRTRPTGKIFLIYLGMEQGRAVFERQTVRFQSDATTMNSSPIIIPQTSTTTYTGTTTNGNTFSGIATTTAPSIVLPPSGSETQIISGVRIRYYLDLTQDRKLVVKGYEILIDEATASFIKYHIEKLN